jgi:hypothetical protein
MKDFYDVWLLASQFPFEGRILADAVAATFKNRGTDFDVAPIAFTRDFTEQASTLAQWRAFRTRQATEGCPERLSEVVAFLSAFLLPIARACADGVSFSMLWPAGGDWEAQ